MITKDIEEFKKDVTRFNDFLLEHDINVFEGSVSFDFMYTMLPFSGIVGDKDYWRGICYYLKHLTRREGMFIEEIIEREE